MRKIWLSVTLALLLALLLGGAHAEEEKVVRRTVNYPGQDIAIAIPAQYKSFYRENTGISINLTDRAVSGYVRVQVLPYDPNFDEADYIENVWLPEERSLYVGEHYNYMLSEGQTQTYTVGGREMLGRACVVNLARHESTQWVLLDRWNGQVIRYSVYFPNEDPDPELLLLSNVVRSVTKSVFAPKATAGRLSSIDCPEQRFSFSADPAYPWKYAAQEGVTVYTQKEGVIPYIMVYQSNDLIAEAFEYLKEQYTPHMQDQYGDNLTYHYEYTDFIIGGKSLPAGWYEYKVQGRTVLMLRIYDSTGPRTAVYTAKFIQGEGDETMAALDAAIRSFQSTAQPIR